MSATPLDIAQALVRIPSVNPHYDAASPGEGAVVDWLEAWGRGQGLAPERQAVLPARDNIFFVLANGEGPHLLLNGHTDTVSVAGMRIDPFGGEVREGRLWGRGAADMKGPLACMLSTLLQLRASPGTWRGTLTVGCVVDEETQYRGILALLRRPAHYDYAVVGEPTRGRVVRGCKGSFRFSLRAAGRAAHSSEPHKGCNAILGMARALPVLAEFFETGLRQFSREGFGPSTGSVSLIDGGSGINIVPDQCRVQVDIRTVPGQDCAATYEAMQAHVRERCVGLAGVTLAFDNPPAHSSPAFETPGAHPLVRTACALTGQAASDVVAFGCDASKLSACGVPSIIFGPGDIAQAHTADESIALTDLEAGAESYVRLARALLPPR